MEWNHFLVTTKGLGRGASGSENGQGGHERGQSGQLVELPDVVAGGEPVAAPAHRRRRQRLLFHVEKVQGASKALPDLGKSNRGTSRTARSPLVVARKWQRCPGRLDVDLEPLFFLFFGVFFCC